jgi:hypothetical protein
MKKISRGLCAPAAAKLATNAQNATTKARIRLDAIKAPAKRLRTPASLEQSFGILRKLRYRNLKICLFAPIAGLTSIRAQRSATSVDPPSPTLPPNPPIFSAT